MRYSVGVGENPMSLVGLEWGIASTPRAVGYSAQQLSRSMSFRKEVGTSLIDSVVVGNTCTVSIMSSIVSLYLTARTASWIMSAAFSARIWTPSIFPVDASTTILIKPLVSRTTTAFGTFAIGTVLQAHSIP